MVQRQKRAGKSVSRQRAQNVETGVPRRHVYFGRVETGRRTWRGGGARWQDWRGRWVGAPECPGCQQLGPSSSLRPIAVCGQLALVGPGRRDPRTLVFISSGPWRPSLPAPARLLCLPGSILTWLSSGLTSAMVCSCVVILLGM